MYLLFYFSRFTVTSWRRICICFSPFSDLQSLWKPGSVSFFLFLAICGHFRIHECICILLFCNLRSLLVPGSVSFFLLLVICSHILTPEMYLHFSFSRFAVTSWRRICICFSPFSDLQSLWKPGSVSFFLFLAICGHFRIHECICILLFCNLRSLLVPGSVSFFLLLVICSHILTPEMYLLFSFSRFAVTYRRQKAMSKAW